MSIRNLDLVKDLTGLIGDRVGSHVSLTKLGSILDTSKETIKEYINALKSSFTVNELKKYSESRNRRLYSPKKYYLNDNGLEFNLTGRLNKGQAIESKYINNLSEFNPKSLIKTLKDLDIKNALVITDSLELKTEIDNYEFEFRPLWKFLLSK